MDHPVGNVQSTSEKYQGLEARMKYSDLQRGDKKKMPTDLSIARGQNRETFIL